MKTVVVVVLVLVIPLTICTAGPCPAETQCYGHGDWTAATQTCTCYANSYHKQWESRYGSYTGTCCTSIECTNTNSTCAHGVCTDGLNCERCQTDWSGKNCDNVTSCFPWLPCKHGKCVKSRFKCECDPGWVGDLCDRSLCDPSTKCVFGACPNDPKKCECYEDFYSPETGCDRVVCANGWECLNGGYCIDVQHCVCPQHYTGEHCETIAECSVPCEHGRCSEKPNVCECEPNWNGTKCETYVGPCHNCSSVGGTCKDGPDTCVCNPGYTGPQCSVRMCDGCGHGACKLSNGLKYCICDKGWVNVPGGAGFDPHAGPCTTVKYCIAPCVHGSCPSDPYRCVCQHLYVGTECDTIQCPKCCPPETCDCLNTVHPCRSNWHHDCCLVKSCFRGDTLVHTSRGLIPIKDVKVGDLVATRHEGDDPSVTHFRKVDSLLKKFVSPEELVVLRTGGEDIWTTYNHPFYDQNSQRWMAAENISTSHVLQALKGKTVNLQQNLRASKLVSSSASNEKVPVYDLVVHEYDRYAVGKDGLLVSSCNDSTVLLTRDKQVWGDNAHPMFMTSKRSTVKENAQVQESAGTDDNTSKGSSAGLIAGLVVGTLFIVLVIAFVVRKKSKGNQTLGSNYVNSESKSYMSF